MHPLDVNILITNKWIKYVVVWFIAYMILLLLCGDQLSFIDNALIASVIALLVCIFDNLNAIKDCGTSEQYQVTDLIRKTVDDAVKDDIKIMDSVNAPVTTAKPSTDNVSTQPAQPPAQPSAKPPEVQLPAQPIAQQPSQSPSQQPEDDSHTKLVVVKDLRPDNNTNTDKENVKWYEQHVNPRCYTHAENLDQIGTCGGKTRNEMLVNEMVYSDFNRLPPSFAKNDFEFGYSFLPPKDWYPIPPYPPVCVISNPNTVNPVYIDRDTMDLKDWWETKKIMPPDSINTTYITNELNS